MCYRCNSCASDVALVLVLQAEEAQGSQAELRRGFTQPTTLMTMVVMMALVMTILMIFIVTIIIVTIIIVTNIIIIIIVIVIIIMRMNTET